MLEEQGTREQEDREKGVASREQRNGDVETTERERTGESQRVSESVSQRAGKCGARGGELMGRAERVCGGGARAMIVQVIDISDCYFRFGADFRSGRL